MEMNDRPTLPTFAELIPKSEGDEICLSEVREVLKRHGALERFGVCLLHQHFPLADDELLVETSDNETRTMLIRPMKKSAVEGKMFETAWRLDITEPTQRCIFGCEWDEDLDGKRRHTQTHKWNG